MILQATYFSLLINDHDASTNLSPSVDSQYKLTSSQFRRLLLVLSHLKVVISFQDGNTANSVLMAWRFVFGDIMNDLVVANTI